MEIAGYIASLLIGVSLGLIGGGGSILTVPVLVYLFRINPLLATAYSLFIVGSTSLVGSFNKWREGMINIRAALWFSASSIITVFLTRKFIIPAIPHDIFKIGSFEITSSLLTMVLFAFLMLFASLSMIRKKQVEQKPSAEIQYGALLVYSIGIGLVTGLLGAGGGFLIIPALVLRFGLPMKQAVGTSLLIITINSLIGFAGDLGHFQIDWSFLAIITMLAIAGIFLGGAVGRKIPGEKLKKGFGWFVLLMGTYIIVKELFL